MSADREISRKNEKTKTPGSHLLVIVRRAHGHHQGHGHEDGKALNPASRRVLVDPESEADQGGDDEHDQGLILEGLPDQLKESLRFLRGQGVGSITIYERKKKEKEEEEEKRRKVGLTF